MHSGIPALNDEKYKQITQQRQTFIFRSGHNGHLLLFIFYIFYIFFLFYLAFHQYIYIFKKKQIEKNIHITSLK